MEILKDLFDEKILEIINLFLDNPEKRFSLTDVSGLAKVNIATTFRILNKLTGKKFIKTIPLDIQKSRTKLLSALLYPAISVFLRFQIK